MHNIACMKPVLSFCFFCLLACAVKAQTLVIAHRGASAYEPENTLAAFEKAIALGADCIETDVHQTLDTTLVLMHDYSVNRTCDIPLEIKVQHPGKEILIKDLSFREFDSLRIKGHDFAPPTLDSAIKLINGRCHFLIEIKSGSDYYPGIEQRILRVIRQNHAEQWVNIIHSFDKKPLLALKPYAGLSLQKLIVFRLPLSSLTYAHGFEKDDFSSWQGVNVHYRFISRRLVKKLHSQQKTIYAWTVNKPKKARKLARRGVDGIITNKPDMVKEIIAGK